MPWTSTRLDLRIRRPLLGAAAPGGRLLVAYVFTVTGGTITAIDRVANPERLRDLEPVIPDD
jgi:hypothetical protein